MSSMPLITNRPAKNLAPRLMLHQQSPDDVEHTADHQQAGEEQANPPALETQLRVHTVRTLGAQCAH